MDFVVDYFPTAAEGAAVSEAPDASSNGNGHDAERHVSNSGARRFGFFMYSRRPMIPLPDASLSSKSFANVVKNDANMQNFVRGTSEKAKLHLSVPKGKNIRFRFRNFMRAI